ncbi:hypothetical protein PGT21_018798 [Puccinia graminis f. sp. tritici]|uniref:Uncharacterized protein n=1 Tax=Puccinia graminis f. sp. tritici TaxID=56615 RepID=A0A5B0R183_PUCGR|nr:hypothetical protein PGT21_018798 [Puccinia graminis f. sp. tritici]
MKSFNARRKLLAGAHLEGPLLFALKAKYVDKTLRKVPSVSLGCDKLVASQKNSGDLLVKSVMNLCGQWKVRFKQRPSVFASPTAAGLKTLA